MPAPKGHAPYPGCETGGRPKTYTDEYIEKEAEAFLKWMEIEDSVWYESFAFERGYTPDKFTLWAKSNEKFHEVYKISQSWQKQKLLKGSLFGKYNASITKLILANTIGWTDKQQVSGDGVNPLAFLMKESSNSTKELVNDTDKSDD